MILTYLLVLFHIQRSISKGSDRISFQDKFNQVKDGIKLRMDDYHPAYHKRMESKYWLSMDLAFKEYGYCIQPRIPNNYI